MRNGHRSVPALLALMFTASLTLGQSWTAEYGIVIQGDIVTMNEALDVIEDGRLVIRDNKILALLGPDDDLPDGFDPDAAVTVVTDGWVFPGLIDAHNHVAYNYLPLY